LGGSRHTDFSSPRRRHGGAGKRRPRQFRRPNQCRPPRRLPLLGNPGAVPGLDGPRHVSQVLLAPALPCEKTRTMIPQANETELEVVFSPLLGVRTGQIPSWKHFLRAQCKRFARGFGPWKPTDPRHPVSLGARRGFHGAEALGRTKRAKLHCRTKQICAGPKDSIKQTQNRIPKQVVTRRWLRLS
jgi:hypothetical protein